VNLALTEMRRSKLRFGLLTAAVSLLVFLIVFLSSLSAALLRTITGALESLPAAGMVYAESARGNLQASRLNPEVVAQVAAVPGVSAAAPISTYSTSATLAGQPIELQLFAAADTGPSAPAGLRSGRFPLAADEVAVDIAEEVAIGDKIKVAGAGTELTVVGTYRGTQFGSGVGWVTQEGFAEVLRAVNPALPFVPVNVVAFDVAPGASLDTAAQAIAADVPGTTAYSRDDAVAAIPGRASINQTFGLLVGITFVIGVVVVGFFFLILTVQKLKAFTLLRATGAGTARLAGSVTAQIAAVVLLASALATLLAYGALKGMSSGLPVRIEPAQTLLIVAAVLGASLVAGLLSVRRISAIDPATAAGAR
jgi:putative ABC transport system permease protein